MCQQKHEIFVAPNATLSVLTPLSHLCGSSRGSTSAENRDLSRISVKGVLIIAVKCPREACDPVKLAYDLMPAVNR